MWPWLRQFYKIQSLYFLRICRWREAGTEGWILRNTEEEERGVNPVSGERDLQR